VSFWNKNEDSENFLMYMFLHVFFNRYLERAPPFVRKIHPDEVWLYKNPRTTSYVPMTTLLVRRQICNKAPKKFLKEREGIFWKYFYDVSEFSGNKSKTYPIRKKLKIWIQVRRYLCVTHYRSAKPFGNRKKCRGSFQFNIVTI